MLLNPYSAGVDLDVRIRRLKSIPTVKEDNILMTGDPQQCNQMNRKELTKTVMMISIKKPLVFMFYQIKSNQNS